MKNEKKRSNKYLILALTLAAVIVLPSCRTRLTNNSEVSNIQYDESGYMMENYQMRRDELELSIAKSPILPDLGAPAEDDEDDSFSEGESFDYDPEDYEEDFTEPEPPADTTQTTPTPPTSRTPSPSTNPSPSRGTTPSNRNTETSYTVTFDANGGKVEGGEKFNAKVKKGDSIGRHYPKTPSMDGYSFDGWYTAKEGGSAVKSSDKVNSSVTLYAHWKKESPKTETYTVKFVDGHGKTLKRDKVKKGESAKPPKDPKGENGEKFAGWDKDFSKVTSNMTVTAKWNKAEESTITFDNGKGTFMEPVTTKKGSSYKLPQEEPTRDGYSFAGWSDGKNTYMPGDEINVDGNIKLTARWTTDWSGRMEEAKKSAKDEVLFRLDDGGDSTIVQECKAKFAKEDEDYEYVIAFAASKDVGKKYDELTAKEEYAEKSIIVLSNDAKKDKYKLAYQIALMNIMHRSELDENQAIKDLVGEDYELSIDAAILREQE